MTKYKVKETTRTNEQEVIVTLYGDGKKITSGNSYRVDLHLAKIMKPGDTYQEQQFDGSLSRIASYEDLHRGLDSARRNKGELKWIM